MSILSTVSPYVQAESADFSPTPTDHAWWSGFRLGIDGIPANPPDDLSPAERAAFESGHDIGHARFVEDCESEFGELLARIEWACGDPWERMHEAEVERVLGHRAFSMVGDCAR